MKALIRYLVGIIILVILSTLFLVGWFKEKYPKPTIPSLDPEVRMENVVYLEAQKPDMVFLGNSTLMLGVDTDEFEKLTGQKILEIAEPGSSSAWWYLILKNNIARSSFKPKTLVLFFTDTLLTDPGVWVTGKYFPIIDEYANSSDELLLNLSYKQQLSVPEKIFTSWLPLYGNREKISNFLIKFLEDGLAKTFLKCPADCMQTNIDDVFQESNLIRNISKNEFDADILEWYTWKNLNFSARVNESYLSEIIQICKENKISLIMVRIGNSHFLSLADEPLLVRAYFRSLQTYLEEKGVIYLDLAYDPRITPDLFRDTGHLNESGKQVFTQILVEKLGPLLK